MIFNKIKFPSNKVFIINYSPDGSAESNEKSSSGEPLLTLKKKDNKSVYVSVLNLQQLSHILNVSKEKKLSETRSCLEGN